MQHTTLATSSIGACWPPELGSNNRIRGFYTDGIISDSADADAFADAYHHASLRVGQEVSRVSIRLVTFPDMLSELEDRGVPVEAAMPLSVPILRQSRGDHLIAYTGHNHHSRHETPDEENVLLQPAPARQLLWRDEVERKLGRVSQRLGDDLRLGSIGRDTEEAYRLSMSPNFAELYAPFGYDDADVQELLTNPNNTVVWVETSNGTVLSTAMAEIATISVAGLGNLVMAEVTEASTLPGYRGQGLYRVASGALICRLADMSHEAIQNGENPIHAIYGEANMNMPGVLQASMQNGRRFASHDAASYGSRFDAQNRIADGRQPFGVLEQNFRVEDGIVAPGRYNSFALSYVPAETMNPLLMYPRVSHGNIATH